MARRLPVRALAHGHVQRNPEIDRARQQGYALIDEELEIGLRSIAVPLRTGRGELVAALSLSVATQRMTRDAMVETLLPEMESARRKFAELL